MVSVIPGYYVVTYFTRSGAKVNFVGKDRVCTCGGNREKPCPHIREVEAYLRNGGQRAPEKDRNNSNNRGGTCPVCGAPVSFRGAAWRCEQDTSHYWQWRMERLKPFFLDPNHPVKRGNAFYEMTPDEREEFLRRHSFPAGYVPYA